jgi:4-amino-4-deoxy-L-arabinose transferase-like glycosyltransferase
LSWLLPAATLVTAGFQWYIVHPYDDTIGSGWSIGILAAGIIVSLVLVVLKGKQSFVFSASIAAVLVLLIGPLYWAATPITYGLNSQTPEAGPSSSEGRGGMGGNASNFERNSAASANESLMSYLEENNTGEPYLFATLDYGTAAPYIVDKGASVVILNGFSNSDTVYTPDTLKALVESGKVKYFLINNSGGMGGGRGGNSELTTWITENGTEVPAADWAGNDTANSGTLYKVTIN